MAFGAPSESPAIVTKEVDLTGVVPNVQSTTGAFVGNFRWGPVEQATLVDNESTLASTFGSPSDSSAVDFLSAAYFLKYSNSLQVVRTVDSDARNAVNSGGTAALIKNEDAFDAGSWTGGFFARYPGDLGNSLKVTWAGPTGWTLWDAAYIGQFDAAPTGNERHVLVVDSDGSITGTAGSVLEKFPFVSSSTTAVNTDGSSNYWKDVINRTSSFVYLNTVTDSSGNEALSGGDNGPAPAVGDYQTGFDLLEDKDTITVDFLIAPGLSSRSDQTTLVNDLVTTAQQTRKDCVVVTSPARSDVVNVASAATAVSNAVTTADTFTNSSYLVVDNNYLKVYDKYNDKYRFIPAASSTAGIMAASDLNAAPWFSPAGSRRGQYLGITALAYTPTKAQRDTLYKAGVNPIANIPGQGVLLYGDKTKLARPSAFDRINVRRLFLTMERAIAIAARNTLFEFNDEFTRAEFVNIVEPFLREIKGRRGITDFRVVCDETNNTPAVIDRNEFVANIFVKPARSINYITLNFVAVRTGVEFEEVAGTV
jgi:hypothetical protein